MMVNGKTYQKKSLGLQIVAIGLFDLFAVLSIASLLSLAFVDCAYAYVDPSVMTYAIQAVAGVAVALSAIAGVALRRVRKKLLKLFDIDENANKARDPQWARLDENEANITKEFNAEQVIQAEARAKAKSLMWKASWPQRLALAFIVMLLLGVTYGLEAPVEIVAGAKVDLSISALDIFPVMLCFVLVTVAIGALALSATKGRLFATLLILVFWLGACGYLQAMFFNGGLPAADGSPIDWLSDYPTEIAITAAIWLILLVALVCFSRFKPKISAIAAATLSVAFVAIQIVAVTSILVDSQSDGDAASGEEIYVTEDGLYEISDKHNVIVMILDMFDTQDLQQALVDDPHLLDEMEGFTWYPNSAGMMLPTKYAIPYLLTREVLMPDEAVPSYLVRRYTEGTFLSELEATGYSVDIYSDNLQLGYLSDSEQREYVYQFCDNMHGLGQIEIDALNTVRMMLKCSLYRNSPWFLKGHFRFYTDDINKKCVQASDLTDGSKRAYVTDDLGFFNQLKEGGLTIEADTDAGAFKLIHLKGAHWPYEMDENANKVDEENTDRIRNARGSMRIATEYLEQLKRLGKYDDSTIIITADHGNWFGGSELPNYVTSPILLVKNSGESTTPIQQSDIRTGHDNFHATVLKAMNSTNAEKYGVPIDDLTTSDNEIRDSYQITTRDNHVVDILLYEITGDVLNLDDWKYTGTHWDAEEL